MTLQTFEQVESELAATADYDVTGDVSKVVRYAAALRRRLHSPAASSEDGRSAEFFQQAIERQLREVQAFIRANVSQTEQQRLNNLSVTHAGFSTFGQYAGGASSNPGDVR